MATALIEEFLGRTILRTGEKMMNLVFVGFNLENVVSHPTSGVASPGIYGGQKIKGGQNV